MEPRPYQQECINIVDKTISGRHVIAVATGLGKTFIFSRFKRYGRTLILSHRDELVRQPQKYFEGVTFGIEKADEYATDEDIVSASVQSFYKKSRLERYSPDSFHTIIVDECHHCVSTNKEYMDILRYFSGAKRVIGVTATPTRGDKIRLDDVFDGIIFSRDLKWGIENGYLSRIRCMQVQGKFSFQKIEKRMGDFAVGALGEIMQDINMCAMVAKSYIDLCHSKGRHTLIYTVNVKACTNTLNAIRKLLPEDKDCIQMITGETPAIERKKILSDFASGTVKCIVNCMVLTEGTDLPICDTILNARPTCNDSLYQQMVGRGTRLYKDKDYALVIDIIPEDGSWKTKALCTAPTLFGIDPSLLSDAEAEKLLNTDLLDACKEYSNVAAEKTKSLKLYISSIDRFIEEREEIIQSVHKDKFNFHDLYEKFYEFYHPENENAIDFGNLYVEQNPDERRRYRIKPNWSDTIYISEPDIMGMSEIEININANVKKIYQGKMKIEDAIQMAENYCILQPEFQAYMWNVERRSEWGGEEVTEAQKSKVRNVYKKDCMCGRYLSSMVMKGLTKLEAISLIDYAVQLTEARKERELYGLKGTEKKATIEKKEQTFILMQQNNGKLIQSDEAFEKFANDINLEASNRRQQQEIYRSSIWNKAMEIKIEKIIKNNEPVSDKQKYYISLMIKDLQSNGYYFDRKITHYKEMTVAQAAIIITVLKKIKGLPSSRDKRTVFRMAELQEQLAGIQENDADINVIKLTPIEWQ